MGSRNRNNRGHGGASSPAASQSQSANYSGVLIKDQIKTRGLICENSHDKCFKASSYDLRLGADFACPSYDEFDNARIDKCSPEKPLVIKPFGCVIVSSHEKLKLPLDVIGKFDLRPKKAFGGLIVQMGTQIHPGYEGRLFALLQNVTNKPIQLHPADYGDRPFTIEFHFTAAPISEADVDRNNNNLTLASFVQKAQFAPTLDALQPSIEKKLEEIKRSVDTNRTTTEKEINDVKQLSLQVSAQKAAIYGALVAAVVTLLVSVAAPWMLAATLDRLPLIDQKTVAVVEEAKSIANASKATAEALEKSSKLAADDARKAADDAKKSTEDAKKVADASSEAVAKFEHSIRTLEQRVERLAAENETLRRALDGAPQGGASSQTKR